MFGLTFKCIRDFMVRSRVVNRSEGVLMSNVTVDKVLASAEFTKSQAAAIRGCFGPDWIEGKQYRRVAPPGAATAGDLYLAVASDKLGQGENGEGGYDMLNLTRKDRKHILAKFSPEKFELVS